MDFRILLKEKDINKTNMLGRLAELCKNLDKNIKLRMFEKINIGDYSLSIQAGNLYYCNPNKTTSIYNYKEMELIIFYKGEWIDPSKNFDFKRFHRLGEFLIYYNYNKIPVGKNVPVDLIQDLVNYLQILNKGSKIIKPIKELGMVI